MSLILKGSGRNSCTPRGSERSAHETARAAVLVIVFVEMSNEVERRRALHASMRAHTAKEAALVRSDEAGPMFSAREQALLEKAAAMADGSGGGGGTGAWHAAPATTLGAASGRHELAQTSSVGVDPAVGGSQAMGGQQSRREPVAMQRIGLTPCHVVRDYGYDDPSAREQISLSGTHHVAAGHLPLRRGELVMVTAASTDNSMLHGYLHEARNLAGSQAIGHRGRAGIFPHGHVIRLLDVPDERRVFHGWHGTGQDAELHLHEDDQITVTAKGGLDSSPDAIDPGAMWYGYCHRTGSAGFFPADCVTLPTDTELVIEVVGATSLPLVSAETADPTVRMTLIDSAGRPKGRQRRSQPKKNSASPVWHCYRDFGVHASPTDRVVVEVFDNSVGGSQSHFVGSVWMSVDELPLLPAPVPLCRRAKALPDGGDRGDGGGGELVTARSGVDLQIDLQEQNHRPPHLQPLSAEASIPAAAQPTLTLRRVANLRDGSHKRMRMIFIRHGESQWNAGQAASHQVRLNALGGLWKMFSQTDHPLSKEGISQAAVANRNWQKQYLAVKGGLKGYTTPQHAWVKSFLSAGRVYASPLTRAVETCLLSLRGHPTLTQRGLSLISSAREIKNLGGQDTVGCAVGEGITARVQAELAAMLGEQEAAEVLAEHGPIDPFDASTGARVCLHFASVFAC